MKINKFLIANIRPVALVIVCVALGYFLGSPVAGFMIAILILGIVTLFFWHLLGILYNIKTIENIDMIINEIPAVIDTDLDDTTAPSQESLTRYDLQMQLLREINGECAVFQDIEVVEPTPEEHAVANCGKYMDQSYGFGTISHRSERAAHN